MEPASYPGILDWRRRLRLGIVAHQVLKLGVGLADLMLELGVLLLGIPVAMGVALLVVVVNVYSLR